MINTLSILFKLPMTTWFIIIEQMRSGYIKQISMAYK